MGAARRFASARLAAFVVCAGGVLLAVPTAGLAANWTSSSESVTGSSGASSVVTGLDNSSNLTAVWADSAGIETNVRTAAGASWGSASSVSVDAGATAPDFAESLGTQLATWVGSDLNVHAATGSGSLGTGSLPLTTSGAASSPQAAIVSGVPTVFWIEGNTIESSGVERAGVEHSGESVERAARCRDDLRPSRIHRRVRVELQPGFGRRADVDTAQIAAGTWTVTSNSPAATSATAVSVAANGSGSRAVAWTEHRGLAGRSLDLGWRVHARGRCNRRVGEPAGRRHLLGAPGVRRVGGGRNGAGEGSQCRGNVGIRDLARLGCRAERECRLVRRRRRQLARLDPRVRRIAPVGDGGPAELAPGPRNAQLVRDDLGRLVGSRDDLLELRRQRQRRERWHWLARLAPRQQPGAGDRDRHADRSCGQRCDGQCDDHDFSYRPAEHRAADDHERVCPGRR